MVNKDTTISARIDKDVKRKFESTCDAMGMTVSDALNIFIRKVISEGAIPFEVKLKNKNF